MVKKKNIKARRPIDDLAEETYSFFGNSWLFLTNTEIKFWKAVVIIAFVTGILSALVWSVSIDIHTSSEASQFPPVLFSKKFRDKIKNNKDIPANQILPNSINNDSSQQPLSRETVKTKIFDDLDKNGSMDFALQHWDTGATYAWLMDNDKINAVKNIGDSDKSSDMRSRRFVGFSDVDEDGLLDAIWQNKEQDGKVEIRLLKKDFSIKEKKSVLDLNNNHDLTHRRIVSFYRDDGELRAIWQDKNTGEIGTWKINSNLELGETKNLISASQYADLAYWRLVQMIDFDMNGSQDFLLQHDAGAVAFLGGALSDSKTDKLKEIASIDKYPELQSDRITSAMDFNRDGNYDIVWQNKDGSIGVWFMKNFDITDSKITFKAAENFDLKNYYLVNNGFLKPNFCAECMKITVSPPVTIFSSQELNIPHIPDGLFNTLLVGNEIVAFTASSSTYKMSNNSSGDVTNLKLSDKTAVLEAGDRYQMDECGAWIHGSRYFSSENLVRAWYHAEKNWCHGESPATLEYVKSVMYAESNDKGKTFVKPNYPNNMVLTTSEAPEPGITVGNGDISVVDFNDYYYVYFLSPSRTGFQSGVARSSKTDKGVPGSWLKYYNGSFSQPGVGGKATLIGSKYAFAGVSYNSKVNSLFSILYINDTGDPTPFRLAFSDDGIHWNSMSEVLAPSDGWKGWTGTEGPFYHYPTIIPADGGNSWESSFYLFYTYVPDIKHWENRYLIRRRVDVDFGASPVEGSKVKNQ